MIKDLSRLKNQLLTSGLQQKDNPLYQVINQLIDRIVEIQNSIPTTSGGSSSIIIEKSSEISFGLDGLDGVDGVDGFPGKQGSDGSAGVNGFPGIDGLDGEDSFIPGIQGIQGVKGEQGIIGPPGYDSEESEYPYIIPGQDGLIGLIGPQGSHGMDGIDGEYIEIILLGSPPSPSSGSTSPGGSDTQVQFNDSGSFGGDAGLTYNKTTDTLTIAGLLDLSGAAAGQIKFPATQNPSSDVNTIDDYEEGTWTPVDASGAGLTLASDQGATALGSYVKIGQMVYMQYNAKWPATADTTVARLGGWPFTTHNVAGEYWGGYNTYTDSGGVTINANPNVTSSALYGFSPGVVAQTNVMMSGKQVDGNIQFRCTA